MKREWKLKETVGYALEHLIKCPIHGVIAATGWLRDKNGKMICIRCFNIKDKKEEMSYIKFHQEYMDLAWNL